jgi:hypothetical protein
MRLHPASRFAPLAFAAAALFSPAAAHPGHGDAHAEPWYNQPREGVPAEAAAPQAATPAAEGKSLRSTEPARLTEESPARAPAAESRTPEAARDDVPAR